MPAERIGMRDAREIIRLKFSSVSTHEIARRLGMARSTVRETLKRADGAGLSWPLPDGMNDEALEAALYASRRSKRSHRRIEEPDWAGVRRELKRKHVTLLILWDEYIAANPDGYSYSRFCELGQDDARPQPFGPPRVSSVSKETVMDKEHLKGAADKAKGAVKDAAGKVMDDKKLQAEGKMDKAKGEAREALGDAKDAAKRARDEHKV